MTRRALGASASAIAIVWLGACSLVQDVDYLSNGADGGVVPPLDESGADGGGTRTAELFVGEQPGARLLVQDADALYWIVNDGSLMSAPKAGGAARKVAALDPGVTMLAADPGAAGNVYAVLGGKVHSVPKSGGSMTVIFTPTPPAYAVIADETSLFVAAMDPEEIEPGAVFRTQKDGATPTHIAAPDTIAAFAHDAKNVFWADFDAVMAIPKDAAPGAQAQSFRSTSSDGLSIGKTFGLAVDDSGIYYVDEGELPGVYRLVRTSAVSDPLPLLIEEAAKEFDVVAIDDTFVYAASTQEGEVWRAAKDGTGGKPELLVTGLPANTLAVDATWLYAAVRAPEGAIFRVRR